MAGLLCDGVSATAAEYDRKGDWARGVNELPLWGKCQELNLTSPPSPHEEETQTPIC